MSAGNPIKPQDVESLVQLFNASDWDEMHVQVGEFEPRAVTPGLAQIATGIERAHEFAPAGAMVAPG